MAKRRQKLKEYHSSGDSTTSTEKHPIDDQWVFPAWFPYFVFVVTLAYRVKYVTNDNNWWILHPDEIYQSVEVAHTEYYGYGFRPFEYMPPPSNTSALAPHLKHQHKLGMHSLRSFLYPRAYVVAIAVADWTSRLVGVQCSHFLISKIFHASVASFLTLAVFRFTNAIYRDRDLSALVCAIVAMSQHLTIFGTHTLVNSFLAPFVFYTLGTILDHATNTKTDDIIDENQNYLTQNMNQTHNMNHNVNQSKSNFQTKKNKRSRSSSGESQTKSVYHHYTKFKTEILLMACGFTLGICAYIRIDLIAFVVAVSAPQILPRLCRQTVKLMTCVCVGGLLAVLVGGLDDFRSYGVWFLSPLQWFRFNFATDTSHVLFGSSHFFHYIDTIIFHSVFTILLASCMIIMIIGNIKDIISQPAHPRYENIKLCCSIFTLFLLYSTQRHKEVRFLHNSIVLFLVAGTSCLYNIILILREQLWVMSGKDLKKYFLFLWLAANALVFTSEINLSRSQIKNWAFKSTTDSININKCLQYLSNKKDVGGVFLDATIYLSGGYSLLRHDVPVYVKLQNEYADYDTDSRVALPTEKGNTSVVFFSAFSNLVSIFNEIYLLQTLSKKPYYNYFVVPKSSIYTKLNFKRLKKMGDWEILKRQRSMTESDMKQNIIKLPLHFNSTISIYESTMLLQYGLLDVAQDKLETVLLFDKMNIRAYQLLARIFQLRRDRKSIANVMNLCAERVGRSQCQNILPDIYLHQNYLMKNRRNL